MTNIRKEEKIITGNYYNKHETTNLMYKKLVDNYRVMLQKLFKRLPGDRCLEIGSGEGYILEYAQSVCPENWWVGGDITYDVVLEAFKKRKKVSWSVFQGESLPFAAQSFDIVLACEVLEHVQSPERVLSEIERVTRDYILISVPQEPIWRLLNMLRLKYLSDFGNTPGHLNHWSISGISQLIEKRFDIFDVKTSFPWTFVVGRLRR